MLESSGCLLKRAVYTVLETGEDWEGTPTGLVMGAVPVEFGYHGHIITNPDYATLYTNPAGQVMRLKGAEQYAEKTY